MIIYIIFLSILIGSYGFNKPSISLILGLFLILLLIKEKNKKYVFVSIIIMIFFNIKMNLYKTNLFNNYGIVSSSKDSYIIIYNGLSKFYLQVENHDFSLLDLVKVNGEITDYSFNFFEGEFDFNSFLESRFIYKQIEVDAIEKVISNKLNFNFLYNKIINKFDEEGNIIISELFFSKGYSKEFSNFISKNKLFYLLNLSSLHLYYLSYLIRGLLESKIKEKHVDNILLVFYFILCVFNNFKISLLRFFIYNLVIKFDKIKKLELSYLKKNIVTLIILGLIDQSYYFNTSFIYHLLIPLNFIFTKNAVSTFKIQHQKVVRIMFLHSLIFILSICIDESFSFLSLYLYLCFL